MCLIYHQNHFNEKVSVYVPENASIDAVTPSFRLFTAANDFLKASSKEPLFEIEFVGLKSSIETDNGKYSIKIDRLITGITKTDLIIIPAIYGEINAAIKANEQAIPWVKEMHSKGSEVASLCIGAFLLGETGLIDERRCSTHWAYYNQFREMFPKVNIVEGSIITDEGKIHSSGGAGSLWNLLIYLLEKYTDRNTAILAAKYFAVDIDRNSQGAFTIFTAQKDHTDKEVLQAQHYIEQNYRDKLTIDDLTGQVNISRRSFERRFRQATSNTPVEYIQRVRVEAAKRNFESSRKNVSEVMFDVGYSDMKAFRDVFKRETAVTPLEYLRKYRKLIDG